MAQLLPDLTAEVRHTAGFRRELDVLQWLQRTLPDDYTVFHGVDWHSLYEGHDCHGEIDLIVMNRAGDLLLVEVKAGDVILRDGLLLKRYEQRERDVAMQIRVQYGAMRQLMKNAGLNVSLCNCLVLPDFHLCDGAVVAIPRERIFDASDFPNLSARFQQLLPVGKAHPLSDQVRAFLSNHLQVMPDVSVLQGQLRQTVLNLSDGLATWVPRLSAPSGNYRIQATAGSGKTQLALTLLQHDTEAPRQALYVCFNRPLADHMAQLAPADCTIATFHSLCIEHYRTLEPQPDFHDPVMYQQAETAYLARLEQQSPDLDLLIIDEAQDFQPGWVEGLCHRLRPEGRLYLLEDPDQRLYNRFEFDMPDAVQIRSQDNFRSPQRVCHAINAFGLSHQPIHSKSPWRGEVPALFIYDGSLEDLKRQTVQAIEAQLAAGIPLEQIVVLSPHGLAHSRLTGLDTLGPFTVRRFRGEYGPDGRQRWTDGDVLVDSVYRFKGQSATAVIMSEIDFAELGRSERARLFVGMTRGLLSVSLVLSEPAAALLLQETEQR